MYLRISTVHVSLWTFIPVTISGYSLFAVGIQEELQRQISEASKRGTPGDFD